MRYLIGSAGLLVLLAAAPTATAQQVAEDVTNELMRANANDRDHCRFQTNSYARRIQAENEDIDQVGQFPRQVDAASTEELRAQESMLQRRIVMEQLKGKSRASDMSPDGLGDLKQRLAIVKQKLNGGTPSPEEYTDPSEDRASSRQIMIRSVQDLTKRYEEALLDCLSFRRRYPDRRWSEDGEAAPEPEPEVVEEKTADGRPLPWKRLPDFDPKAPRREGWDEKIRRADSTIDTSGWDGTYEGGDFRYVVTGSADGRLNIDYQSKKPGLNQSGGVGCSIVDGRAECIGTGTYKDDDKSVSFSDHWSITLSGRTISGTYEITRADVGWRVEPYSTFFVKGRTGSFSIEKVGR